MKIVPVVMDDLLVVIMVIPPIDRLLQMDFDKFHNLPALHPDLEVQFSYIL